MHHQAIYDQETVEVSGLLIGDEQTQQQQQTIVHLRARWFSGGILVLLGVGYLTSFATWLHGGPRSTVELCLIQMAWSVQPVCLLDESFRCWLPHCTAGCLTALLTGALHCWVPHSTAD